MDVLRELDMVLPLSLVAIRVIAVKKIPCCPKGIFLIDHHYKRDVYKTGHGKYLVFVS